MKILITVPVYNEAIILEKNIHQLAVFLTNCLKNSDWQILIADNGSTDETVRVAEKLTTENPKIIFWHTDKKGRGNTLRQVWQIYEADIYFYMDADLATDLKHVPELLETLSNHGLATGSRLLINSQTERSALREIISRTYNFLAHRLVSLPVIDTQCGFKAITQTAAKKLLPLTTHDGWFFDTELLALAEKFQFKIKEIPVTWRETRDARRKSSVKIFSTAWDNIKSLWKLRKRLKTISCQN